MRQAIVTKYLGPTNHFGGRIKASAWGGSITIPYTYDRSQDRMHRYAAEMLAKKMGWEWGDHWVGGGSPDEAGFCFVDGRDGLP